MPTTKTATTNSTTKSAEKEIIELENQFWQALQDQDVEAALEMTDDPCIVTGAQGVGSIDHDAFRGMMEGAQWKIDRFELSDETVRMIGDDVALVAYKVKEELTVDGKKVTLEAADASTWIRRNSNWVCALHTESILGDPYGRDRKPVK